MESVKRNSITSDTVCVEIKRIERSWMMSPLRPLEQLERRGSGDVFTDKRQQGGLRL